MKPAQDPKPRTECELFLEALEQPTPEARAALLQEVGARDPALRAAVETLLRHHKQDDFLETPALARLATHEGPPIRPVSPTSEVPEKPGDRIGPYKLLQPLGEGGVGIVFMAEQEAPIRRRVALKVLKPGMDTRAVIARFESERQALALMDHPNIARVFDAGTTPSGRPFFVMELVPGLRITDYCDRHRLPLRERLALFIQVCEAIQHAHQKGIIHRDIKPSNVLVTHQDGSPRVKVIDFGIAKALDHPLTDKTLFTELRAFLGTPAYMSPEQADLRSPDIDTRSDIYSLGVLLYELLTGLTPFDEQELAAAGLDGMRRIILERDPVPPSQRLLALPLGKRSALAALRGIDPHRWPKLLKGDLDCIVTKTLEKDRSRRYTTAHALAQDIQRYLHSEPIQARPPSTLYRLRKIIRRHRLVSATAAAATLALLLGLALTSWQAHQKDLAYQRALQAEQEQARLRQEAETARQDAELRAHLARLHAYAADMNLAHQALVANNLGRARELLDRHQPATPTGPHSPIPGSVPPVARPERDLRGWEWRYLWQLCQSDALFTLVTLPHEITRLSISHDGRWLTIGQQGRHGILLWDLRTRRQHSHLPPDTADEPFVFSPTAPLLAFVSPREQPAPPGRGTTTEVHLWDIQTQTLRGSLSLPGPVTALAFSSDGDRLLTVSDDSTFTLWRISDASPVARFQFPYPRGPGNRPVLGSRTTVTPDLALAAQAISDGHVRVLDLTTGRELWNARVAEEHVTALALSPDGQWLASAGGFVESTVRLWNATNGQAVARLEGHRTYVRTLVFWPHGRTLASGSGDQTIHLWDLGPLLARPNSLTPDSPSGPRILAGAGTDWVLSPRTTLRGHRLEVWSLALAPDRTILVSGAKDGQICVWDTQAPQRRKLPITLPAQVEAWTFTPAGDAILTLDQAGHVVRWSGSTFELSLPLRNLGSPPRGPAHFSPDGRLLAVTTPEGSVQVWSLETGQLLIELGQPENRERLVGFLSPSNHLITVQPSAALYRGWDPSTGRLLWEWHTPPWKGPTKVQLSSHGPWLISLAPDDSILLRLLPDGPEQPVSLPLRQITAAAMSPDQRWLAAVSLQGTGLLFDRQRQLVSAPVQGFLQGAHSVAFSPDGRRIAIGSNGNEAVKLWDVESLQELLTLPGQGSIFNQTAFSPDGNLLVSCNMQGTLHIWRAPSFEEIARWESSAP